MPDPCRLALMEIQEQTSTTEISFPSPVARTETIDVGTLTREKIGTIYPSCITTVEVNSRTAPHPFNIEFSGPTGGEHRTAWDTDKDLGVSM